MLVTSIVDYNQINIKMSEYITASTHAAFLAIGLIMPLGMQNVFIFNQGASHENFRNALPSIITASLCDALLISLAVLGISLLVFEHAWTELAIFSAGCCFLIYMGFAAWQSANNDFSENNRAFPPKKQILFALSVSLLNPHAIIDTVIVIGSNATAYKDGAKWVYAITCIIVSSIWFFSLAFAGYRLHKIDKSGFWVKNINKLSAVIIWIVAGYIGMKIWECVKNL